MQIDLNKVPPKTGTGYPEPFKAAVAGRVKQQVGNAAGLKNFGVNRVTLAPGSASALRHWHTQQDEFIYVIAGELTLITDAGEDRLSPGMMAGFPAGEANGHHLVNRSDQPAVYLEVGDRTPGDVAHYSEQDLLATDDGAGYYRFTHRDGQAYG
ncbi:MAG: cupin domain-containing protein [Cyanobacteria bacterium J06635_15]